YQNYVAKSQATACLADIRGGVTAYEEGIQSGTRTGTPSQADLGLATSTPRCDIAVAGAWDGTGSTITCSLKGNPNVAPYSIVLTRNASGQWPCSTGITNPNHQPN